MARRPSRRDFLRRTAAGAAAAAVARAHLSARDIDETRSAPVPQARPRAPLGPTDIVRLGIVGTGGMGSGHADALARLARDGQPVRLDAIADVNDLRADAARTRIQRVQGGDLAVYRRYQDLLARPDLHGVVVAAPEHWHGRIAEDAIKAGKDVYVEKPMTLNLKDALRLRQVVRANPQVVFCVGTQFLMTPSYVAAESLIAEGAIGKPVWSQTSYCRNSREGEWTYYAIDPAWRPGVNVDWKAWCGPLGQVPWNAEIYARWRRYRKYSTGIIGDLLVHQITPMIKAIRLGWPLRVVATGGHYVDKAMENFDQVNLTIEFEGDHTMVVAGSTCNELGVERIIRGHKANLYVGGRTLTLRPERIWADQIEEREIPAPPGPALDDQEAMRRHWIDCIRSRQPTRSDVDLATKVMVIVDLASRSMWEGGAFAFDPRTLRTRRI
jgi:predicted dehydrogenase